MRHFEACQALEGVHVEVLWDHVVEDHGRGPGSRGPSHTGSRSALRYPVKKRYEVTDRKWGVKQLKLPLGEILVNGKSSGPSRKATPTLCVSLMNRTNSASRLGKHFCSLAILVPWQTQPVRAVGALVSRR